MFGSPKAGSRAENRVPWEHLGARRAGNREFWMPHVADLDLSVTDISGLSSLDALAAFFTRLGYPTGCRFHRDAVDARLKNQKQLG